MKIFGTPTSAYVRKVRVFAAEKGVDVDFVVERPSAPGSRIAELNPLGKIPVLVGDDGEAVYDSVVIVDYLEGVKSEPRLVPADFRGRIAVRRWEALADGIIDAVVNVSHQQGPMNDAGKGAEWIARQEAKIEAALSLLERSLAGGEWLHGGGLTLADIAAGTALACADYALPGFERKRRFPGLSAYAERLLSRASFRRTDPSAS